MTDSGLLTGLTHLVEGRTRSISPENFHGEKGKGGMATEGTGKNCARELGQGWKISPSVDIPEKGKLTLAEIEGSGIIQHIWLTCPHEDWRSFILRMYWDDEEVPSIEVPLGDFFCMGWCEPGLMQSIPICVNPKGGMNSFTKALAKELAPSNIQVNAISCGVIDTAMNHCFSPEEMNALREEIPADRLGQPEEVAKLVLQLIQAPTYLTGQILTLDGGWQ